MAKSKVRFELDEEEVKKISETSVAAALEFLKKEKAREQAESKNKKLHNTKLLLKNYKSLKIHCESAICDAQQVDEDYELHNLIEMMTNGNGDFNVTVDSIKKSVAKTRLILDHIDFMLNYYKKRCEESCKPEIQRRYEVVFRTYLKDDPDDSSEIMQDLHIEKSSYYRDLQLAILDIGSLLFGCM